MAHRIEEAVAPEPTLRVLPRGRAMVSHYGALTQQTGASRRFLGWKHRADLGHESVDETSKAVTRGGAFVRCAVDSKSGEESDSFSSLDHAHAVTADDPHRTEYLRHLRDGDLWAADEATAAAARVPFEPDFGGEHPEFSRLPHCQKVIDARAAQAKRDADALAKKQPAVVSTATKGA